MEKKYIITREEKEQEIDLFRVSYYLNEEKKFIPFDFEIKTALFETKEEANQFIINSLPDLRVRNLMNKKKEYYQVVEVSCAKDVYYFDKQTSFTSDEIHMIYQHSNQILIESSVKIYTIEKIASFQKKQPGGCYIGYYYVL